MAKWLNRARVICIDHPEELLQVVRIDVHDSQSALEFRIALRTLYKLLQSQIARLGLVESFASCHVLVQVHVQGNIYNDLSNLKVC